MKNEKSTDWLLEPDKGDKSAANNFKQALNNGGDPHKGNDDNDDD